MPPHVPNSVTNPRGDWPGRSNDSISQDKEDEEDEKQQGDCFIPFIQAKKFQAVDPTVDQAYPNTSQTGRPARTASRNTFTA